MLPALLFILDYLPFTVLGFHSDNGSEYINGRVAKLLQKLLIEQTKSRAPQHMKARLPASKKRGAPEVATAAPSAKPKPSMLNR